MVVVAAICILSACTKMDSTYKGFLKDGEIRYSKRPDSIQVFPGYERIKLSWLLIADSNATKCRVYWNNGADSVEVPVTRSAAIDTISVVISNLAEGNYTFSIYTYDSGGNPSIRKDTTGHVYGDEYVNSLANRLVRDASLVGGMPRINWYSEPDTTAVGTEILYKDGNGVAHQIWVPLQEAVTRMEERPLGDSVQYRTLYLPDSLAIDTFYAPYETLHLQKAVPIELDKSKFAEYKLLTDAPLSKYAKAGMAGLWDDNIDKNHFYGTNAGWESPHWFTFDMGVEASLDHFVMWQRGKDNTSLLYANANPLKFEIWGSNDPNPNGLWDSTWVKLMDCESVKPSGLPLGDNSDDDIAQALAGETFNFPDDTPPVRYIRIKILSTWDPADSDHSFIAELTFFGVAE